MGLFSNTTKSISSGSSAGKIDPHRLIGREEAKRIMMQAMDYRSRQKLKPFIFNSLSTGRKSIFKLGRLIYKDEDLGRIPRNKFNAAVKKYYEKISGGSAEEIKEMENKIKKENKEKTARNLRANLAAKVAAEREIEGPLTKEKLARSIYNKEGSQKLITGSDLTRKIEEREAGIMPPAAPKAPMINMPPIKKI